jgi:O-acetyl-ADP-ribose deacetylase (regulator of RNase III)
VAIQIIENEDIFSSNAQTLVNTVNCLGVMGKGIALRFKTEYPEMFNRYQELCAQNLLAVGKLYLYKTRQRWILNFPTKTDWRYPSKEEYIEKGLEKFVSTYRSKGISSVAFPLLGASNGKLDPVVSLGIMKKHLSKCDIPVYIYINIKPMDELPI